MRRVIAIVPEAGEGSPVISCRSSWSLLLSSVRNSSPLLFHAYTLGAPRDVSAPGMLRRAFREPPWEGL
jgi:hypothetical protein